MVVTAAWLGGWSEGLGHLCYLRYTVTSGRRKHGGTRRSLPNSLVWAGDDKGERKETKPATAKANGGSIFIHAEHSPSPFCISSMWQYQGIGPRPAHLQWATGVVIWASGISQTNLAVLRPAGKDQVGSGLQLSSWVFLAGRLRVENPTVSQID